MQLESGPRKSAGRALQSLPRLLPGSAVWINGFNTLPNEENSPLVVGYTIPIACDGKNLIFQNDGLMIFYDFESLFEQLVDEEPAPEKEEGIISLFPNPATGAVWIKTAPGGFPSGLLAEAYNLSGRMVLEQQLGPASLSAEIPVGHLAKGVYFMVVRNLESGEVAQRFKFVKY
ncbi:MAG: T9SS type A sorting domain-containing protein [Phaeodactylibacter sp.]|nr:T9SS type A sorting domain-containing protein [Phaeodactylibacter sp.]